MSLDRNPFTHAYLMRELWFYGLLGEADVGRVAVRRARLDPARGSDDYLNVNMRQETPEVPVVYIDGQLGMSLTPLTAQALAVPINRARGRVGTAGLGLGYYALRVAAKANVSAVDVYESDPDLIAWFLGAFAARPELRKIRMIEGDARETVAGKSYDVFFADIHGTLLLDEVVDDAVRFRAANTFGHYSFCGAERVVLDAYLAGETASLDAHERRFFRHWRDTPSADPAIALPRLYRPITDAPFRRRVFEALGRPWSPAPGTETHP